MVTPPSWLGRLERALAAGAARAGHGLGGRRFGGSDSVGLLRALVAPGAGLGLKLSVAHLDHGVRGDAARADAALVAELAAALGLPFDLGQWQPAGPAISRPTPGGRATPGSPRSPAPAGRRQSPSATPATTRPRRSSIGSYAGPACAAWQGSPRGAGLPRGDAGAAPVARRPRRDPGLPRGARPALSRRCQQHRPGADPRPGFATTFSPGSPGSTTPRSPTPWSVLVPWPARPSARAKFL